jgi:uncharacterized protein YjbI with pentapeptide repeats
MLTKNLTPFAFGTKVTSRRPPQPEMTIVVRATYALAADGTLTVIEDSLEAGSLCGDTFADDDRDNECIHASDFADFKLNAEVLFSGSCHAPNRSATECPVQIELGEWSKSLHVFGERQWSATGPSKPKAFEVMPLTYANAFGGEGLERNPVGSSLPNVELPSALVATPLDRPEPASFAPLHPDWPQRKAALGKRYDKSYVDKRAPFYAEDFDWGFFSAGAGDQQLEGYLRGDEVLKLVNLHPGAPVVEATLPGLRVRAFVKDGEGRFREVKMALDTVAIEGASEPDEPARVHLSWRGVDEVADDDLDDVAFMLLASEELSAAKEDEAHYRAILQAFEEDPTGVHAAMPPDLMALHEAMQKADEGADPYPDAPEQGNPVSNMLARKLGPFASKEQERLKDAIEKSYEKTPEEHRAKLDEAFEKGAELDSDEPPTPVIPKPGALPDPGLRKTMRLMLEQAKKLREQAADERLPEEARPKIIAQAEAIEQVPLDPGWKKIDPEYEPPLEPISTEEPGPGANLAEQDLSGRDLRGVDLTGANLEMANLTKANLAGVKLVGAKLKKAVLYKTDLTGADLSEADLTRVNAAAVRASGATLRGAVVDEGFFEKADFSNANLEGVTGSYQAFANANLSGASARGCSLTHADFTAANLADADFSEADLTRSVLTECSVRGAKLVDAKLTRTGFEDADATGADFYGVEAPGSLWMGATVDDCDFGYAVLTGAHFTKASAKRASFSCANLREARLYRTQLEDARIVQANLFRVDACKSKLNNTKFTGSNLYDSKFLGAKGSGADFTDAVLTHCTLTRD